MTKNMGIADRAIRIIIALAIVGMYLTGNIAGTLALILGMVAILFLVTGLTGWCPAYLPFNFSTRKTPASRSEPQPPAVPLGRH